MTADVELLPLPEGEAIGWTRAWSHDQMRSYARANVSRATARLQAEIEALRAEVERLKALVRSVGYETLDRAEQAEARAERLAEALREAADMLLADYPETAKRLRAACCPTAAQENDDA